MAFADNWHMADALRLIEGATNSMTNTIKKTFCRAAVVIILLCCVHQRGLAMPASPHAFDVAQPDGQVITLNIYGDEYFHWYADQNLFTVIIENGTYVYAKVSNDDRLVSTGLVVGGGDPSAIGLTPMLLPSAAGIEAIRQSSPLSATVRGAANAASPVVGVVNNVVIMMRFQNHLARPLPANSDIDTLFNSSGVSSAMPSGSVKRVYAENSYGQLSLESTVIGWVDLPHTEQFYAGGQSGLTPSIHTAITDALNAADPLIDFSQFDKDGDGWVDAIAFIHSGYGAEFGGTDSDGTASADRIWSHRWNIPTWTSAEGVKVSPYHISPGLWGTSGSAMGRVGVICHETGHFFGLPDFYDTNKPGEGCGSYGMMANSWGFDGTQFHPPHFSPFSKFFLGWATPTPISPGFHTLPNVEFNPVIYRIDDGYEAGEYLLIENRQPMGVESDIPQGGLCIWHIDENISGNQNQGFPGQSGWPSNGLHYRNAVLQADGNFDMERGINRGDAGDLYHGMGVSEIGPATLPDTDRYAFGFVADTGHVITNISNAGSTMSFLFRTTDCNNNGIDDLLESADPQVDCNGNGVPDECENAGSIACPPTLLAGPDGSTKDRYLSLNPMTNGATPVAIRVTRAGSSTPWYIGCTMDDYGGEGMFAQLVQTPEICVWSAPVIHVRGCEIVPGNVYTIDTSTDTIVYSREESFLTTSPEFTAGRQFGDLVGVFIVGQWSNPDGLVTANDIVASVQKFQLMPQAPHTAAIDTDGKVPNGIVAGSDILRVVLV